MRLNQLLAGAAAVAIAASACSAGVESLSSTDGAVRAPESEVGYDVKTAAGTETALPDERQIIITSRIDIRADDTRAAMDDITALAARSGGFVATATVNPSARPERPPVISMTIRIPADKVGDTMAAIRSIAGEVVSETLETEDITEEYVDLEARLRNLLRLEDELVAFLTEARTNPNSKTDDLLRVFQQVSDVRAQIEELEGRKRFLDNRVDLATVGISITPMASSDPIVDEGWTPSLVLKDALRRLVGSLQNVADAGIWLGVFAVPLLVVIGIPVWAALLIWLSRRKTRESREADDDAVDRLDSREPSNPE